MLFHKKPTPEQSICTLTGRLGVREDESKEWASPVLGRWSLKRAVSEHAGSYYELNIVEPLTHTLTFPAKRFVYLPDGTLCGVVKADIDPIERNYEKVEEAMYFQVETGLSLPLDEDKQELISLLEAGISQNA